MSRTPSASSPSSVAAIAVDRVAGPVCTTLPAGGVGCSSICSRLPGQGPATRGDRRLAPLGRGQYKGTVGRQVLVALYVVAMVVIIVGVDVLLLRHQFWPRLLVNIGIVAVFAAAYFAFFKRP